MNRAVEQVKTRDELFEAICRISVQRAGFKLVTVAWHDPKTHLLIPRASAGGQQAFLEGIYCDVRESPDNAGPVGICFQSGRPSIVNDSLDDPRTRPWRERRIRFGLQSTAALPLRLAGELCGVFAVYASEKDVFQEREVGLLEEIADSISFALDHLDHEARRRDAEEALRQREAQYRAVIETTADGFYVTNIEGHILEVNDAYLRLSGYDRDELLGMHVSELEAIEPPEETAVHIHKMLRNGSDLFESRHRAKDGTIWPVEANVAYWQGSGGRILTFTRDITGRKQAEEALREQIELQAQLTKIAEAVPGAVYTFRRRPDGGYHFPYASPPMEDLLGLPRHVMSENLTQCFANVHPEDLPGLLNTFAEVARTHSAWHAEFRYQHPERGLRWIEGWSALRVQPDGSLLHHGFMTDVTARKQIDEALRDSEAKLRAIVSNVIDAILTVDAEGLVLSFNPAAERVFGYRSDEVIGRNFALLLPPSYTEKHDGTIVRHLLTEERGPMSGGLEMSARRKDGTEFPVEIGLSQIESGQSATYVGILRDVTERKAHERDIERMNRLYATLSAVNRAVVGVEDARRPAPERYARSPSSARVSNWSGSVGTTTRRTRSSRLPVQETVETLSLVSQSSVMIDRKVGGRRESPFEPGPLRSLMTSLRIQIPSPGKSRP